MPNRWEWVRDHWAKKADLTQNAIVTNRFDREDLNRMLEEVPRFDHARESLSDFTSTGRKAAEDAFMSLFKPLPDRRDLNEMLPEFWVNHAADEAITQLDAFKRLKQWCQGDDVQAALAFEQLEPDYEIFFDQTRQEQQELQDLQDLLNEAAQKNQELQEIEQMIEQWLADNPPPPVEGEDEGDGQGDGKEEGEGGEQGQPGEGERPGGEGEQPSDEPGGQPGGNPQPGTGEGIGEFLPGFPGTGKPTDSPPVDGQGGGQQIPQELKDKHDAVEKALQGIGEKIENILDKLDETLANIGQAARQALKEPLEKTANETEQFFKQAKAWGLDPADATRIPAAKRMELARRLNTPTFKKIADLFGPMQNIMFTEQTRKTEESHEEVINIETGDDLARMLPDEMLALAYDEDGFVKRYMEQQMLQYQMRGEEHLTRGGIIFCKDSSSSMSGDRFDWSTAVMLCLMHLARQQKRPFHLIHFASAHQQMMIPFETPEDYTIEKVLDAAEIFLRGGTNFEMPMTMALEILKQQHAAEGSVKADIVFVTDDECYVPEYFMEEYLKESDRMQFTTWGIAIPDAGMSFDPEGALAQMSQGKVFTIQNLRSGDDIRGMFRGL